MLEAEVIAIETFAEANDMNIYDFIRMSSLILMRDFDKHKDDVDTYLATGDINDDR